MPHLDIFLFEMQNVTATRSTFVLNYLFGIKKKILISQRLYSLSAISKRESASSGHAHLLFSNTIEPTSKISVLYDF